MAEMMSFVFLCAVLASALINEASSLKCYECISNSTEGCNASNSRILDCSSSSFSPIPPQFSGGRIGDFDFNTAFSSQTFDYKCLHLTTNFGSGSQDVHLKTCFPAMVDVCKSRLYKSCSTCETDLCNSSVNVKAGSLTLIFGLLIGFVISK